MRNHPPPNEGPTRKNGEKVENKTSPRPVDPEKDRAEDPEGNHLENWERRPPSRRGFGGKRTIWICSQELKRVPPSRGNAQPNARDLRLDIAALEGLPDFQKLPQWPPSHGGLPSFLSLPVDWGFLGLGTVSGFL